MSTPPPGYAVRPASLDDASAVAELNNACSLAEGGVPVASDEETRRELREPGRDLATDTALVTDPAGRLVACLLLYVSEGLTEVEVMGFVHPDSWGRGLGSFLIELGEERARMKLDRAPPGERVVMRLARWAGNAEAERLFRDHGYRFVRRFWMMRADLDVPPPAPRPPAGIELRPFVRERDERPVHGALEEAFGDHWGAMFPPFDRWAHHLFEDEEAALDPGLCVVAVEGEEVVAAALCRMGTPQDAAMGWIDELAVRRPWRGRGIGLALLRSAFGELHRRGVRTAGLAVDSESPTGATRLYEKAGMRVDHTWESWEKELRPAGGTRASRSSAAGPRTGPAGPGR